MRVSIVRSAAFALVLLSTHVAHAKAPEVGQMRECSPPVLVAGLDAQRPELWSTGATTYVFYGSSPNYGGDRNIHFLNFGLDNIPGTPDDTPGTLSQHVGIGEDTDPSTDGRYVVFNRNTGSSVDVMLYDLGPDLIPQTLDDVTEVVLGTYPNSWPNLVSVESAINDGLVAWAVGRNPIGSLRSTVAMCDTRRLIGTPGSCSSPVNEISLPQFMTFEGRTLRVLRDYSMGFELHLGYLKTVSISGLFNIVPSSIIFEPNFGYALLWPGNSAVKIQGFFLGLFPLVSNLVGATTRHYLTSPLNPTPNTSITPIASTGQWEPFLAAMGTNAVPSSGHQAVVWMTEDEAFFQTLLLPGLRKLRTSLFDPSAELSLENLNVDGKFVAYEHFEFSSAPYPARHGLWVTDCD